MTNAILIDTSTGSTITLAPSQVARSHHASIFMNGNVYLFGGHSGAVLSSCEKFNLEAGTWEYINPLPIPAHVTLASKVNDLILISGYQLCNIYSYNETNYEVSLGGFTAEWKYLIGNFMVVTGAIYEYSEGQWVRYAQATCTPTGPYIFHVAKRGDFYYLLIDGQSTLRLDTTTREIAAIGGF